MLEKIRSRYPGAYSALETIYQSSSLNKQYFQYLLMRRFCKCNFCKLDTTEYDIEDVDAEGKFNLEKVECPMRGECQYEGVICMPKFNSKLSAAELRVMEQLYRGKSEQDAAKALFLSPNTIHQHIKSVYVKLGIHRLADFIQYANNNNLFNK